MKNSTVLPIIVLFHPNEELLYRLLFSLVGQVNTICIIDNTPVTVKEKVLAICNKMSLEAVYFDLNENKGIAYAQNVGIRYAIEKNYSHVLLLDQDSQLPCEFISNMKKHEAILLNNGHKVAAVGPAFKDEKTNEIAAAIQQTKPTQIDINTKNPIHCDYIIASGSLIRTSVFNEVGLMLDELFIDWVDIEWGERCAHDGFNSYMIPSIVMNHSIGDEYVNYLGRKINLHSDFRNYFIVRNAVYLLKLKKIKSNLKLSLFIKIPQYVFFYSLFSKRKCYSFFLLLRAIGDGAIGKMDKGYFN
ncbi:glycosyltransferase family 2 protein [Aeromonas sp. Y293-4]|uniref:glycosyltransferase family 2 protein n=1 Tax=Aeromonas sp. Y293-4 TaxID=2990504 RepID=UPI0022E67D60|nr:glycosyltransferase family 2 protein [Aeromonas sp. Y293-4]